MYLIEPNHLELLKIVRDRLYSENRLTGDEMRDLAQTLDAVVRPAEQMGTLEDMEARTPRARLYESILFPGKAMARLNDQGQVSFDALCSMSSLRAARPDLTDEQILSSVENNERWIKESLDAHLESAILEYIREDEASD